MKNIYIRPEFTVLLAQTEQIVALSLQGGKADNSDALVKGTDESDIIWGDDDIAD